MTPKRKFKDGTPNLDPDTLSDLRRERIAVEAPDVAKAINLGEELVALVDGAHNATAAHLVDLGRELPNPDDGGEAVVGNDGLRELSGS